MLGIQDWPVLGSLPPRRSKCPKGRAPRKHHTKRVHDTEKAHLAHMVDEARLDKLSKIVSWSWAQSNERRTTTNRPRSTLLPRCKQLRPR